jgi:hypothetical protein
MNPFPPAYAQLPAHRPLGAVTLTSDLQAAAKNLQLKLASGCLTTPFDECSSFQTAYNNAGGNISLDGLYGPETQAALQSVLTTIDGSSAPAACVAGNAGSTVPALSPTIPSNGATTSLLAPGATVNLPFFGATPTRTLLVGAAGLLAAWLVGSALWKTYQEGGIGLKSHAPARHARASQMPTRPHRRRRNPVRRRRIREKARERVKSQGRDERTGRFQKA